MGFDKFVKVIMPSWWADPKTAVGWYKGRIYLLHPDHQPVAWNGKRWLKLLRGKAKE